MPFNFRLFFRTLYLALFKSKGTHARLTLKRLGVVGAFCVLFPMLECVNWLCFLLDDLFFPAYRTQPVPQPVFVMGNPRSGTTFLHRLMAQDTETFTCLRTWEIFFAPSVTQRKIVWAIGMVDRWLGGWLHKLVTYLDRRICEATPVHCVGINLPEEDVYLLLHIWSTIAAGLASSLMDIAKPYVRFDVDVAPEERARVMRYYKRCLQRHCYAHGGTRQVLSKNPYFTPKIAALYETFPDAKIIYLARNPLRVVPSYTSLSAQSWHVLCSPLEPYPFRAEILEMTQYWYRYPLMRLKQEPAGRYRLIKFDDLIADLEYVVMDIYHHFDIALHPDFVAVLRDEAKKARHYRSQHPYSLEQMRFTREQIVEIYRDVFVYWDFDTKV